MVYDICNIDSFAMAKDLMKAAAAAGAGCVLFGNKFNLEKGGKAQVNVMDAKDVAASNQALALEASDMQV